MNDKNKGFLTRMIKKIQDDMEDSIKVSVFGVEIETTQKLWDEYQKWTLLKDERINAIFEVGENPIGAIGGNMSLRVTPTSIGMCYSVEDSYEKDSFNLTNYSNW